MIVMVLILGITVSNPDTGELLYQTEQQVPQLSYSRVERMDDCLEQGQVRAHLLATQFRLTYPNASANITCKWREGSPV
jgi:hypothetical protein